MRRPPAPLPATALLLLLTVLAGVGTVAWGGGRSTVTPAAAKARPTAVGPAARPAAAPPPLASHPRPAWVAVSVASVWASPASPRPVDRKALGTPADVLGWLHAMTVRQRLGLADRLFTQVLYGDRVVVLRRAGAWRQIRVPDQRGSMFPTGIVGWVPAAQVTVVAPPAATVTATVAVPRAWLRAVQPDGGAGRPLLQMTYGTRLPVVGRSGRWLRVGRPGGGTAVVASSLVRTAVPRHPVGTDVVREARRFIGLAYLWAGTSGYGFDCSGLTYAVYRQLGVRLARDAADQAAQGIGVDKAHLRPGDLVFFGPHGRRSIHHVGIYAGDGMMIDAPRTGRKVRVVPMWQLPLAHEYWGARRYLHTR